MPPPRYNPVTAARSKFLGDPYPATHFPPVGSADNAFGGYMTMDSAVAKQADLDDWRAHQDDLETKRAGNAYSRLDFASRSRVLPYSTEADIATSRLARTKATLDERNSPFMADAERERALTDVEQEQMARRVLPETEKLGGMQRQEQMDEFATGERKAESLKIDPLAYDFHLRNVDKTITSPKERQRLARNAALRLQNDQPYVDAVEQELYDAGTPELREKYLEDIFDPETGSRFTKINDKAPPGEVAGLLRKHQTTKTKLAQDREERIARSVADTTNLKVLDSRRDELVKRLVDYPDDEDAKKKKAEIDADMDLIRKAMYDHLRKPSATGGAQKPDAAKPSAPVVPVPAADAMSKTGKGRWSGK